jgi:hypothetical protein
LIQSEELASESLESGNRKYYIDLKKDPKGELYVKLSERSNNKRSTILVGVEADLPNFMANLAKAHSFVEDSQNDNTAAFATQKLIKFPNKTLSMSLIASKFGPKTSLVISEDDQVSSKYIKIFIDMNMVDSLIYSVKSVMKAV